MLASIAIGLLASCAQPPKPPPPAPIAEEIPPPPRIWVRRHHVPRPPRKPEPPVETATPATGEAALAMIEPTPTTPAATAPLQPKQLVGLDEASATRLLGAASAESEQPPAKVWHYAAGNCGLDLYFYYDLRSSRMRTLRYSFKGDAVDTTTEQECMNAIAAARRG